MSSKREKKKTTTRKSDYLRILRKEREGNRKEKEKRGRGKKGSQKI